VYNFCAGQRAWLAKPGDTFQYFSIDAASVKEPAEQGIQIFPLLAETKT